MESDKILVERARQGDERAFGNLVEAHYEKIFRLLFSIVRNEEDARELGQQTWIKVWKNLSNFREDAAFSTWVYRIATFTARDFLRKRKRSPEVSYHESASPQFADPVNPIRSIDETTPADALIRKETLLHFERALAELSEKHRTALVLREIEGLSYTEIARIMDCRTGTVMSRLYHARKSIQKFMEAVR